MQQLGRLSAQVGNLGVGEHGHPWGLGGDLVCRSGIPADPHLAIEEPGVEADGDEILADGEHGAANKISSTRLWLSSMVGGDMGGTPQIGTAIGTPTEPP